MLTKSDLSQIEGIMEPIKQDVSSLRKDVGSLKKNVRYIKKTVDVMIDLFDTQDIKLIKRVDKIETHLGFANP